MYNYTFTLIYLYYRDDRLLIILQGQISLQRKNYGVLQNISCSHTLGEEAILDLKHTKRRESAFAEAEQTTLIEIGRQQFQKLKHVWYQMGLKNDYLLLESVMRKCHS